MKEHKPSRRDITKILGQQINGWNDKRKTFSRIKLTESLSHSEQRKLAAGLSEKYPNYRFAIGDIRWKPADDPAIIVTAITFWK
jgi:hypothetical protein